MGPDGRGPTPVPRARDRAGPGAGAVGAAGEHLRDVGAAHGPAGTGDRDVARFLGHADLDRTAQCVPGRAGRGAPAPAAWWEAAADPVRDPGRHPASRNPDAKMTNLGGRVS